MGDDLLPGLRAELVEAASARPFSTLPRCAAVELRPSTLADAFRAWRPH